MKVGDIYIYTQTHTYLRLRGLEHNVQVLKLRVQGRQVLQLLLLKGLRHEV